MIYAAYYNADMTEGRGPMLLDVAFTTKEMCDSYIDGKSGVMGRKQKWSEEPHGDWETRPIMVCESLEEIEKANAEKEKQKALSKLTRRERELLGL